MIVYLITITETFPTFPLSLFLITHACVFNNGYELLSFCVARLFSALGTKMVVFSQINYILGIQKEDLFLSLLSSTNSSRHYESVKGFVMKQ